MFLLAVAERGEERERRQERTAINGRGYVCYLYGRPRQQQTWEKWVGGRDDG